MSSSCLVGVPCISVLVLRIAAAWSYSLICVSKSVTLVVEANFVSHSVPLFVKVSSLALLHISVNIVLTLLITNSLLYNFSSLSVEHAFMSHFLMTSRRIFIHLLPLGYSFSIGSNCALSLSLIYFLHRSAIRSHLGWVAVLHHLESISGTSFHPHHVVSLTHHLVDISEAAPIEEGIVLEWVVKSEALEHTLCHLVELIVNIFVSLHHLREHIFVGVWNCQGVVTFRSTVWLNWPVSIGHLK